MPRGSITDADIGVPSPRAETSVAATEPTRRHGSEPALVIVVAADERLQAEVVRRLAGLTPVLAVADASHAVELLSPHRVPPRTVRLPADLVLDAREHRVTYRGAALPLTQHEHLLFCHMASDPGRAWTHDELHWEVWGSAYLTSASDLHSTVKRLRRKLYQAAVPLIIESVRGVGFRLLDRSALQTGEECEPAGGPG